MLDRAAKTPDADRLYPVVCFYRAYLSQHYRYPGNIGCDGHVKSNYQSSCCLEADLSFGLLFRDAHIIDQHPDYQDSINYPDGKSSIVMSVGCSRGAKPQHKAIYDVPPLSSSAHNTVKET